MKTKTQLRIVVNAAGAFCVACALSLPVRILFIEYRVTEASVHAAFAMVMGAAVIFIFGNLAINEMEDAP